MSLAIRRITPCAALVLGIALLPTSEASAYCLVGESEYMVDQYQWNAVDMPVPIWLVAPNATIYGHAVDDVERGIGRTIDIVNRYGMSELRFEYAGARANGPVGDEVGVFYRETSDCDYCDGAIACTQYPNVEGDGDVNNITITLVHNPAECPSVEWDFYPDYAGCGGGSCVDDLPGSLVHELVHAAGFAHSGTNGNCSPGDNGSEGVMNSPGTQFTDRRYLSPDDVDGLVDFYGKASWTADFHYSFDGALTWTNGSTLGSTIAYSALGGVSKATEGETYLWMAHSSANSFVARARKMFGALVESPVAVGSLSTYHPSPAAYGDGTLMVARFVDGTRTNNSKSLKWAWTVDEGANWDSAYALRDDLDTVQTRRSGLHVAYDPKTARFIAAYVGDENVNDGNTQGCADSASFMCDEVRIVTITSDGSEQDHLDTGKRASVAPVVACGDTASTYNCVVAWTDETDQGCLHWGHGRVLAGGDFSFNNDLSTNCLVASSPVGVAFDETEAATPWRLALSHDHVENFTNRIYTYRKGSSTAATWGTERSFTVTNGWRMLGDLGRLFVQSGERLQVMYVRD